jgi:hypothetical protein
MTIYYEWLIPGKIIYTRGVGNIEADELCEVMVKLTDTLSAHTDESFLHYISDSRYTEEVNANLKDMKEIFFNRESMPSLGWTVCVTPGMMDRFITGLVLQFTGVRQRQYATIEEALTFLTSMDDTLPDYDVLISALNKLDARLQREYTNSNSSL